MGLTTEKSEVEIRRKKEKMEGGAAERRRPKGTKPRHRLLGPR